MSQREGISITVSSVAVTMLLAAIIELPVRVVSFPIFGTRVELFVTQFWWIGGAAIMLAAAGAVSIAAVSAEADRASIESRWARMGLPAVTVVIGFTALPAFLDSTLAVFGVALGTGLLLAFVLWLQSLPTEHSPGFPTRPWLLRMTAYGLAILLFPAIYGLRVRSLLSATAVALASGALGVEILRLETSPRRAWLYGGLIALLMGELSWALNYWGVTGVAGGLALFLSYYLVTSAVRRQLQGNLQSAALVELGIVALAGVAGLASTFSWSW